MVKRVRPYTSMDRLAVIYFYYVYTFVTYTICTNESERKIGWIHKKINLCLKCQKIYST